MSSSGHSGSSSSTALKRLTKEYSTFQKSPPPYATVATEGDNLLVWKMTVAGPKDTPYEGGSFKLELKFPDTYPIKPPEVRFLTSIYHPNVSMKANGAICQDIVTKEWSPVLRVENIAERIYTMLITPHAETPLEAEIGEMYNTNAKKFKEVAQQWTKKYAM